MSKQVDLDKENGALNFKIHLITESNKSNPKGRK